MEGESFLRDDLLIGYLMYLKEQDYDQYMELVVEALQNSDDAAVSDPAPIETKLGALNRVLDHMESKENYETCAFIRDLKDRIENGSKE
jgi:hypothetical protein